METKAANGDKACKADAGVLEPRIDRNRCEAKADCVRVCPYDVFEIQTLSGEQRQGLSWIGSVKSFFHRGQQAFAVRASQCHGCGLCVAACPEHAITLVRAGFSPFAERL